MMITFGYLRLEHHAPQKVSRARFGEAMEALTQARFATFHRHISLFCIPPIHSATHFG